MGVAKLTPEKELWVKGTTVPTLIKAVSYFVASAVSKNKIFKRICKNNAIYNPLPSTWIS